MAVSAVIKTSSVFKKGDTIFHEGDVGNEMYIIKTGRVEVVKNIHGEEIILAKLQQGSFFGEMALFGDKHRSATIRAIEDSELIIINKKVLDSQLMRAPDWFVAIMKTLVQRLKETNKRIKSRYTIGLEYSLLKTLLWILTQDGERADGGLKGELGDVTRDVQMILGVSRNEIYQKLRDFMFVHVVKYSIEKNEVFIPDVEKLENFLLFLQAKNDKKTRMTSAFEDLKKDPVSLQYFERIYRLLARKKGLDNDK